jgi:hypothetical protein
MTKPKTGGESAAREEWGEHNDGIHSAGSKENRRWWKRWLQRIRRNQGKREIQRSLDEQN